MRQAPGAGSGSDGPGTAESVAPHDEAGARAHDSGLQRLRRRANAPLRVPIFAPQALGARSASLCSTAYSAACVRLASPSLPRMLLTYVRAVPSLMNSEAA